MFISRNDGSWFGTSACIERMTQMSSMCLAVCAKSSLTSRPHWPYFWNLNGEGNAAPVRRSVRRFAVGSGLPAYFVERRLGVERIDLARPAVGEDVDDALRLRREVRLLGRERVEAVGGPGRAARQRASSPACSTRFSIRSSCRLQRNPSQRPRSSS